MEPSLLKDYFKIVHRPVHIWKITVGGEELQIWTYA
jgi:hypothetical protein